jgi:mevalonate kinase
MPAISATAPGKIILFGEHAVVYGRPAIAVPVNQVHARAAVFANPLAPAGKVIVQAPDIELDAELTDLPQNHPIKVAIEGTLYELNIAHPPAFTLRLTSTIPIASGMGSGAATAVAVIRAVASFMGHPLDMEKVSAIAYEVEKIHHGTPSGIDNTVVTYAKPVIFKKEEGKDWLEILSVPRPFKLVIGDTGVRSSTAMVVGDVRQAWQAQPSQYEAIFDKVGQVVLKARYRLENGFVKDLGTLMNENQEILQEMGVSSPELDRLVQAALSAGASGAKLSGGGRGGNMIALVTQEISQEVASALETAGAVRTIIFEVRGSGSD